MAKNRAMRVRRSVIAGRWYPGTESALRSAVDGYLDAADKADLPDPVMGLIAPHAGYIYSGPVAAYSYKQVEGEAYDRAIIISPVHSLNVGRFAVSDHTHYETPLGLVEIDAEMVEALEGQVSVNRVGFDNEHSLEIQLPFLQCVLPDVPILPIMMGAQDMASCQALAQAIASIARERKTLLIASTDLAHIASQVQVLASDRIFMADFKAFDPQRLSRHLASGETAACGGGPVVTIMMAAKALGATGAKILHHATSYDVTHDESYVVGYAAGVILGPPAHD